MNEFIKIAQAISEVGVLVICAAFVIWFAIHQVRKENKEKKLSKELEIKEKEAKLAEEKSKERMLETQYIRLMEMLQEQNNKMLEQSNKNNEELMKQMVAQVNSHVPSKDENKNLSVLNNTIDTYLKELLINVGAGRVSLIQYHNGARNLNKMSFLKMSITNEQVKLGVKPLISEFKDQFRSVLSYVVNELEQNDTCYITDLEDLKEKDAGTYEFLIARGVNCEYISSLRNSEGTVLGFINVVYEGKPSVEEKKIKKELAKYKERIQTLLNFENNNKEHIN